VRGPRDFSRVLGLSFQGPRGAGAPCSGVAVSSSVSLCCPEIFFGTFRLSFRSVFRLKRKSPSASWGPEFPPVPSEARAGCLAARRRRPPLGAAVEGAAIWSIPRSWARSFESSSPFCNLIHKLWISRGGFLSKGPGPQTSSAAGLSTNQMPNGSRTRNTSAPEARRAR
jgi:hypothetical protein